MKRILFLYYSHSGHTEKMVLAAAAGAREAGAEAIVKKTPDALRDDLLNCDAIILGTGNYFQKEAGMFRDYWDRYDYEWLKMKREIGIKPFAWVVSAGVGGDACIFTVNNLMHQLNFRRVFPTVVAFEDPTEDDLVKCRKLGRQMAELAPADDYAELDPPRKSGRWKWPEKVRLAARKEGDAEAARAWGRLLTQDFGTKLIVTPETDAVSRFKMVRTGRFEYTVASNSETSQMIMADGEYADRDSGPFPVCAVWVHSRNNAGLLVSADSPINDIQGVGPGTNLIITHRDTYRILVYRMVRWLHQNHERLKESHPWLEGARLEILLAELQQTFIPVHEGLKELLKELNVWTNALEERSEANAALIDRYCQAYQACQDMADEKEIPVRGDNPRWVEMWQNYQKENGIPPVRLFEGLPGK